MQTKLAAYHQIHGDGGDVQPEELAAAKAEAEQLPRTGRNNDGKKSPRQPQRLKLEIGSKKRKAPGGASRLGAEPFECGRPRPPGSNER
jgi:hypothetical protein